MTIHAVSPVVAKRDLKALLETDEVKNRETTIFIKVKRERERERACLCTCVRVCVRVCACMCAHVGMFAFVPCGYVCICAYYAHEPQEGEIKP